MEINRGAVFSFAEGITTIAESLASFLIHKNNKYGNSVNTPLRIFSETDDLEQIYVRIDDKLSRLAKGCLSETEYIDTLVDLTGYLLILLYNLWTRNRFDPNSLLTPKHLD